jgi:hypothetical protein
MASLACRAEATRARPMEGGDTVAKKKATKKKKK